MMHKKSQIENSRREAMKKLGLGSAAGIFGLFGNPAAAQAREIWRMERGHWKCSDQRRYARQIQNNNPNKG